MLALRITVRTAVEVRGNETCATYAERGQAESLGIRRYGERHYPA